MLREKRSYVIDCQSEPLARVNGELLKNDPEHPAGHIKLREDDKAELIVKKDNGLAIGGIVAICGLLLVIIGLTIISKLVSTYREASSGPKTSITIDAGTGIDEATPIKPLAIVNGDGIDEATPVKPLVTVNGEPIANDPDHPAGSFKLKENDDGIQGNIVAPAIDSDEPGEYLSLEELNEEVCSDQFESYDEYLAYLKKLNSRK